MLTKIAVRRKSRGETKLDKLFEGKIQGTLLQSKFTMKLKQLNLEQKTMKLKQLNLKLMKFETVEFGTENNEIGNIGI